MLPAARHDSFEDLTHLHEFLFGLISQVFSYPYEARREVDLHL